MNLRLIDIFKYLFKWKYRIIAAIILSFFAARFYVSSIQTSVARVVIEFNDTSVSNGTFPNGSEFDQYQIVSPEVLQNVINALDLKDSVESLRRRITVTPIIPKAVDELRAAKAKNGEEYEYHPTSFVISYNGKSSQEGYKVRELLETLVFKYIDYYSESYSSIASITNVLADEKMDQYDYIEETEVLEDSIDDIISKLESCKSADDSFRSTATGYCFQDLIYEYQHLKDDNVPSIYADLYEGRISKNTARLVEVYKQRADDAMLKQKNFEETARMTKTKMDSFSEANKEVPNAYNYRMKDQNNDDLEIIDGVYDRKTMRASTKTTYDTLIEDYTSQLISANDSYLEATHCKYVAEVFSVPAPAGVDTAVLGENVKREISTLTDTMNKLYVGLSNTLSDYNDYSSQKHISQLTGVRCNDSTSAPLYELIAVVVTCFFMIMLAICIEIVKVIKNDNSEKEACGGEKTDEQ